MPSHGSRMSDIFRFGKMWMQLPADSTEDDLVMVRVAFAVRERMWPEHLSETVVVRGHRVLTPVTTCVDFPVLRTKINIRNRNSIHVSCYSDASVIILQTKLFLYRWWWLVNRLLCLRDFMALALLRPEKHQCTKFSISPVFRGSPLVAVLVTLLSLMSYLFVCVHASCTNPLPVPAHCRETPITYVDRCNHAKNFVGSTSSPNDEYALCISSCWFEHPVDY